MDIWPNLRQPMKLSMCSGGDLLCYATSNEVMAALAWLGMLLTIGGFGLALWQLHGVAKATTAAATAIAGLKTHLDGVNLAYVSAQLSTIAIVVRSSDFVLAQSLFSPIKRSVRLQAHAMNTAQIELDSINRAMGTIDKHLEWGRSNGPKYSAILVQRSLDDLLGMVTAWEGAVEKLARTERPDENN